LRRHGRAVCQPPVGPAWRRSSRSRSGNCAPAECHSSGNREGRLAAGRRDLRRWGWQGAIPAAGTGVSRGRRPAALAWPGRAARPYSYEFRSVLIPGRQTWHLPAEIASNAKILPIFEGMSEIQRMLIGRTVTGLEVRRPDLRFRRRGGPPGAGGVRRLRRRRPGTGRPAATGR
jgi:hypothetical protein